MTSSTFDLQVQLKIALEVESTRRVSSNYQKQLVIYSFVLPISYHTNNLYPFIFENNCKDYLPLLITGTVSYC